MSVDRHTREIVNAAVREALAQRDGEIRRVVVNEVLRLMGEFVPAISRRLHAFVEQELADMRGEIAVARLRRTVEKINARDLLDEAVREEVVACMHAYGIDLPRGEEGPG